MEVSNAILAKHRPVAFVTTAHLSMDSKSTILKLDVQLIRVDTGQIAVKDQFLVAFPDIESRRKG